jgi:hypothetical protein
MIMKQAFEIKDIDNVNQLFGREQIVRKLMILAKRCENTSIIGARRFGKTSLLKSVVNNIRSCSDINVYPIYLDFKSEDIKGTDAAYRYMISVLVTYLYNDDIFTSEDRFGTVSVNPSDEWIDVDEQINSLSGVKLQSCLKRIICFFAEIMNKTILFVIDEYEYLFKYVLDTPASFMKLRELSTSVLDSELRPFMFWIAGALSWDSLCSVIGSGECNPISATEYVGPINKDDFMNMWEYECNLINDEQTRSYIKEQNNYAWIQSGGVPFYGKIIGAYILRNHVIPEYTICAPFFREMMQKTLSTAEINILKSVSKGIQVPQNSLGYSTLQEKGLIVNVKSKTAVSIEFLKEYLLADIADLNVGKNKKNEHETLTSEIGQIIENINKTQENKKKKLIFKPTVDSQSTYKDLTGPCYSSDLFAEFSCALYRMYFEWTKDIKPRDLLPQNFRYNEFAQYVDIARHSLGKAHQMDTFDLGDGKKSKSEMLLNFLGTANEPKDSNDFYKLQLAFLRMFKAVLSDIQNFVRKD